MRLYSTNHRSADASLREAVFKGLPDDNGLYMPTQIASLPSSVFEAMPDMSFQEIAFTVSKALIGEDVPDNILHRLVNDAVNFDAPLVSVHDNLYALELFHGPTLAFKDFGGRFMSRLMRYFLESENQKLTILVATSGDTGSAVAQGFLGIEGIDVVILYPSGKVSEIQEKQLTTCGQNVKALEVNGTFDDCQRMVKEAFLDNEINSKRRLTSANSINISRLIPQSFYYFYAWAQMSALELPIVFSVPSGNFGNLCGGLIAHRMGLPISHFVAATNANNIVPHYLQTGIFEPKPSVSTIANAMDVGNPSNFPRLKDIVGGGIENERKLISGYAYDDAATRQAIKEVYQAHDYVMCPHSAIGYLGLRDYLKSSKKEATGIFLCTAHPCKFLDVVEPIIENKIEIPAKLQEIIDRPKQSIKIENSFSQLKAFLLS